MIWPSNYSEVETTVLNGMPITVCFEVAQPEHDVGIFTPYIEDIWLEVKGKRAEWLEKRLTSIDWKNLEEEVLELWREGEGG
jgi:hypothetical protein|tara:strand:- start:178 stop:423 length:246 start_codon:yes stop_codon:yes gene_type:complete